jgi:homoaconitase/3-isopropylmalate dehydratase large subunit
VKLEATFALEFFSRRVGRPVRVGEVIWLSPDHIVSHDGTTLDAVRVLKELGVRSLRPSIRERMKVFVDHSFPPANALYAEKYDQIRDFCTEYDVRLFDKGDGISHSVMVEEGYVAPGDFVAGADSHTTAVGAVPGAFGAGFGGTDIAAMWISGRTWFPVPASILVRFTGQYPPGTDPVDGALHMLRVLQPVVDEVRRRLEGQHRMFTLAVEFAGEAFHRHTLLERMPFSTLVKEANADTCTTIPAGLEPNPDAYEAVVDLDLSSVEPLVVLPPQLREEGYPYPFQVVPVREVEGGGHVINRVSIQSCTGAYDFSIREAAELLDRSGAALHPSVQFYVVPATRRVKQRMLESGHLIRLIKRGAIDATPSCGNCIGRGCGVLGPRDRAVSTSSRNEVGRMGSPEALIYLASALTATASAINGCLTDPRRFWDGQGDSPG